MRNQQKKRLRFGGVWMVLLVTVLCVSAAVRPESGVAEPETPQKAAVPQPMAHAPEAQEHTVDVPQEILDFAAVHPDAADFAAGYPGTVLAAADIDLSQDCEPGEIPLLLQFDPRWGYAYYGGRTLADLMALSACGPTALSMAVVGLTGDTAWNPLAVAEYAADHGYWTESDGTKWLLISEGCRDMGLTASEVPLDQGAMERALLEGCCIICVVGPGDFTDKGHFLVICDFDSTGFFIRDPASRTNSEKTWTYEQLSGQINAMWAMAAERKF